MGRPLSKRFLGDTAGAGSQIKARINGDEPGVVSIAVDNGGTGYTVATVSFKNGKPGKGLTAHAVIVGGVITDIVIDNPGSGYGSAPKVVIEGDGDGAAATATLSAGSSNVGYLQRQKNSKSFFVKVGAAETIATLVDKAPAALLVGEMAVVATKEDTTTFNVAKITNRFVHDFAGNKYPWSFAAPVGNVVQVENA